MIDEKKSNQNVGDNLKNIYNIAFMDENIFASGDNGIIY